MEKWILLEEKKTTHLKYKLTSKHRQYKGLRVTAATVESKRTETSCHIVILRKSPKIKYLNNAKMKCLLFINTTGDFEEAYNKDIGIE